MTNKSAAHMHVIHRQTYKQIWVTLGKNECLGNKWSSRKLRIFQNHRKNYLRRKYALGQRILLK